MVRKAYQRWHCHIKSWFQRSKTLVKDLDSCQVSFHPRVQEAHLPSALFWTINLSSRMRATADVFGFVRVKAKQSRLKLTVNIPNKRIRPNVPLSVVVIAMKHPNPPPPHPVKVWCPCPWPLKSWLSSASGTIDSRPSPSFIYCVGTERKRWRNYGFTLYSKLSALGRLASKILHCLLVFSHPTYNWNRWKKTKRGSVSTDNGWKN